MDARRLLILAGIVTAFYYFTLFDDGGSIDQRSLQIQQQLSEEQKKVGESEKAIKRVEQIRASLASLHEQFKVAAQQLPEEIKASEILKTVDTLAKSAGVSIKVKEPREAKKEEIVETLPLHIRLQGSYSEVTMFLYYISIMERITRITSFTMQPAPTLLGVKSKPGTLAFDGEIMSYRYTGEAPKDGGKKK
jgi:type IV pilus assembly protein PilO